MEAILYPTCFHELFWFITLLKILESPTLFEVDQNLISDWTMRLVNLSVGGLTEIALLWRLCSLSERLTTSIRLP